MLEESATMWRDCLSRWALGTLRKTRGGEAGVHKPGLAGCRLWPVQTQLSNRAREFQTDEWDLSPASAVS